MWYGLKSLYLVARVSGILRIRKMTYIHSSLISFGARKISKYICIPKGDQIRIIENRNNRISISKHNGPKNMPI